MCDFHSTPSIDMIYEYAKFMNRCSCKDEYVLRDCPKTAVEHSMDFCLKCLPLEQVGV